METEKNVVTVSATVNAPVEKVWEAWTNPKHIMQWTHASEDWHSPYADNDLQAGGKFKTTMAAKDGSFSFDFGGTYTRVDPYTAIEYTLDDGRTVKISFVKDFEGTEITEIFDPESQNPVSMQQEGWQAILNNFKKHAEAIS
ncbi:SRPBCC family protein [Pedobacter duraquae]|uniref:Uncharacterized protein YndB with AHSA1/START domain n=1 Tax=Pedobacter duraquae TaxID=425511 RepID=A0A4R6IJX5_9SPHI|nr:SRPBCC family protein [Pedobacter duraquae]TDO22313.1 uncharacterized protein YndB with AHSA1/START domain [Pedobacter duraquae]